MNDVAEVNRQPAQSPMRSDVARTFICILPMPAMSISLVIVIVELVEVICPSISTWLVAPPAAVQVISDESAPPVTSNLATVQLPLAMFFAICSAPFAST